MRAAFLAASLGLAVNAHLFISSPTPIEGSAPKSPLAADGSDFPCHGATLPTSGGETMSAGSSQLLAFDTGNGANTATHGGGSCQISITYETDAAKVKDPKNWYVIYSIEGGCPSNTLLNLDGNYQGPQGSYTGSYDCTDPRTNGVDCMNQFNFTIPKGVKDGHAIMSWTWFNNVGNREMYQNCINTQLSGGDGSEMDKFPNMFVANIAGVDECPTTAYQAVAFPNPGQYVLTKTAASKQSTSYPLATPTGQGCSGDGGSGSGSGSGSAPSSYGGGASSAAPTAAPSSAPYSSPSAAPSVSQAAGGSGSGSGAVTVTTMATVTGSAPSSPAESAPAAASSSSGSSGSGPNRGASPNAAPSDSSSSGSSGSCASGAVSCSNPGSVVCIGSSQFGICNIDNCAVPEALAAGTTCSGGVVAKRGLLSERHARHARRHLAGKKSI